jgi:hypothetical protein
MIEKFRDVKFRAGSREKIDKMVEIVEEYQRQGLRLTARQLYYQFVSRDLVPNTAREYRNLTALLTEARYAGVVDWDAIEDRGRVPQMPSQWSGVKQLVDSALRSYRLPRWEGQGKRVELWVEKQALAGVLWPIAHHYHATLMVNKGYSSASAMYESAERFKIDPQPENVVFYLGDHDPSGEDMVRDVRDRLTEFGVENLHVEKIALTMKQVRQYSPPPNPAKMTDSRAAGYVEKHGTSSWEVDALPPEILDRLIRSAFDAVVDRGLMDGVVAREERDKASLRRAVAKLRRTR